MVLDEVRDEKFATENRSTFLVQEQMSLMNSPALLSSRCGACCRQDDVAEGS